MSASPEPPITVEEMRITLGPHDGERQPLPCSEGCWYEITPEALGAWWLHRYHVAACTSLPWSADFGRRWHEGGAWTRFAGATPGGEGTHYWHVIEADEVVVGDRAEGRD